MSHVFRDLGECVARIQEGLASLVDEIETLKEELYEIADSEESGGTVVLTKLS